MIGVFFGYMLGGVCSANKNKASTQEDFEEFQRQYVHKANTEDTEA